MTIASTVNVEDPEEPCYGFEENDISIAADNRIGRKVDELKLSIDKMEEKNMKVNKKKNDKKRVRLISRNSIDGTTDEDSVNSAVVTMKDKEDERIGKGLQQK